MNLVTVIIAAMFLLGCVLTTIGFVLSDRVIMKKFKQDLKQEVKRNQRAWYHNGWRSAENLQHTKFKASDQWIDGNFEARLQQVDSKKPAPAK
jgi:hypothetical protein